jgi:GT2 family glycosyltransferase
MRNSRVGIFVVLDNDTVVPNDFIERVAACNPISLEVIAPVILHFLTRDVWSCGGLVAPDGTTQQLSFEENSTRKEWEVDWAPGACLIMSRETWVAAGEFDSWMNFLFEDIEWCYRVKKAGGRITVRSDLQLFHEPHQSFAGQWSQPRVRFWARNGTFFRMAIVRPGIVPVGIWLGKELLLAVRDLSTGRASWSVARLRGLAEGLVEGLRRRI